MRFSELELQRIVNKGLENITTEEEIAFNILNFIHCIHLNGDDFYNSFYDSQFYGDLEMSFKKKPGSLIGHCKVIIKNDGIVQEYLFTADGFELLEAVINN